MRCHYLSDLHLESQDFHWRLPKGDVLIVAGDLCHARCLSPDATDPYAIAQRDRSMRFIEQASANFAHVLLVAGNHEHYDGVFDDTAKLLREHLPGIAVLDNQSLVLDGLAFFGTTLWSDFEARSPACLNGVRRRCGEFFFVQKMRQDAEGGVTRGKFQPEDAIEAFDRSMHALRDHLAGRDGKPTVVISHHAPSRRGLNAVHAGNGLDGAFASDLDDFIAGSAGLRAWVHGHTHVRCSYRIGDTTVRANCRGFEGRDASARTFTPDLYFDI